MSAIRELPQMAVRETLECECGGEMKATGFVHLSYPQHYEHKCDRCGQEEYRRESYPRTVYYPYDPEDFRGTYGTVAGPTKDVKDE